jgi:hypothetical protein
MTKQVSKVVVYFTDGTYQEVGTGWYGQGGGGLPSPFNPAPKKPIPAIPEGIPEDPYVWPGETGKWPSPPFGTGVTILD